MSVQHIEYVLQYRAENAAQGSLGAALGSGGLGVSTAMYSVLALLAPFPFYAWSPEVLDRSPGLPGHVFFQTLSPVSASRQ